MASGKKLYSYVEVDDSTPVQKLKISDQLRVLLKHLTYDPANELKSEDAVTTEMMTLRANLSTFLRKATDPIRRGKRKEVIVNVSNKFDPVFKDVIESPEIADYYQVSIVRPKIEYNIPYDFMVRLRVKEK
ncbi:MAG: hypothetical protein NC548_10850 [Lachnospiraceae bacterium]|nr:hypothetical protein [Lachnospiraceae bacterium]